jgi:hypothetical protein
VVVGVVVGVVSALGVLAGGVAGWGTAEPSVTPGALAPFIATLLVSLCKSPDALILSFIFL